MFDTDGDVAIARWESDASALATTELRVQLLAFAERHGMATARCEEVGMAVSEALAAAAPRDGAEARGRVRIGAATDGDWLAVQIDDEPSAKRLGPPTAAGLADRVEWAPGHNGIANRLLMEFAMNGAPRMQ